MRRCVFACVLVAACCCAAAGALTAASAALITREEALALAYPGATVTAERVFLTAEQKQKAEAAAGAPLPSALVARYVARIDGRVVGRAYADTHTVRTKKETLLVSLDANGGVKRVDVTAFLEPSEYQAPKPFLNQYPGKRLSDDLHVQRAIRPIAGATLTARAVTDAVRRVLAIDAVIK
jgi:FMN-binding protein